MNATELTARVEVLEAVVVELAAALSPMAAEEIAGRLTGIAGAGDIDAELAEWLAEDLVRQDDDFGQAAIIRVDFRAKRRRALFGPVEETMADAVVIALAPPQG
ncbi:hypothetical protein [Kaistia soli]|nr:hypothetical protein [Kaistia soli]